MTASVRGFVEGAFLVKPCVRTRDKPIKGSFYSPNNSHCGTEPNLWSLTGDTDVIDEQEIETRGLVGQELRLKSYLL